MFTDMDWVFGALLVGSIVAMIALVINQIRLENWALKQMEKDKHRAWDWN